MHKKQNTAKDYFIIWIVSLIIFFPSMLAMDQLESDGELIGLAIIMGITFFVGVAAFLLMFAKALTSSQKNKKPTFSTEREEIIEGPENSGFIMSSKNKIESKISDLIDDDINDVVFKPKKQSSTGKIILIILAIILFFGILSLLDSQTIMNPSTTSEKSSTSEIDYRRFIDIATYDLKTTASGHFFMGTIKNSSSKYHITDIIVRLDFSKDEAGKDKFDTRYITIPAVPKSGALTFNEPVYINPPVRNWWYTWQIEDADGWEQ